MVVICAKGDMIFETCRFNEYAEQVEERGFETFPENSVHLFKGHPFRLRVY
jgi:hypothetical protein